MDKNYKAIELVVPWPKHTYSRKVKLFCFVSMSILVIDESADDQGHISV